MCAISPISGGIDGLKKHEKCLIFVSTEYIHPVAHYVIGWFACFLEVLMPSRDTKFLRRFGGCLRKQAHAIDANFEIHVIAIYVD